MSAKQLRGKEIDDLIFNGTDNRSSWNLAEVGLFINLEGSDLESKFQSKQLEIACTFTRELALARDDLHFLTWEHPLVRETIDVVYHSELGNASVALIKQKSIKPGTVLIETLHTADCQAPKRLQIGRYLDQSPLRFLISLEGRDLSEAVNCETLTRLLKPVSITQSAGVIREPSGEQDRRVAGQASAVDGRIVREEFVCAAGAARVCAG